MLLPLGTAPALALALVACTSPPLPIARDAAEATDAAVDVPAPWRRWVGFDPWTAAPLVDWEAYLKRGSTSDGRIPVPRVDDACLFEVVHVEGDVRRRWHVLVRSKGPEPGIVLETMTVTLPEVDRSVPVPVWFYAADVTVAPEGRSIGPARSASLPAIPVGHGFTVSENERLERTFGALRAMGRVNDSMYDRYAVATSRPAVALLAIFRGIQAHRELSAILREVVDAPSALEIVLSGGLSLTLSPDLEATRPFDCPIGSGLTVPGVRFPATLVANGEPALEMEIFATNAVRPFHVTSGLVGLRAWLPGDRSRSVDLRIVSARAGADG